MVESSPTVRPHPHYPTFFAVPESASAHLVAHALTIGYPAARTNPAAAKAQPAAQSPRAVETRGALVPGSDSF